MRTLGSVLAAVVAVLLLPGCCRLFPRNCVPPPPQESVALPLPDPLNSEGDALYGIYRKGIITRHIAKNGRFLESIGLESIDDFSAESYDESGFITVTSSRGTTSHKIPVGNARYSEELTGRRIDAKTYEKKPYLWVPVLAPAKYPGYDNTLYHTTSARGDNPLYYGGMALATLSLEHKFGVSPHSLEYARKLVRYFLRSEMNGQSGYLVRRPDIFDSNRAYHGDPILQGAGAEELMGALLGLMYYTRVEPDPQLRNEAIGLRDRILSRVPKAADTYLLGYAVRPGKYEHGHMMSSKDPSYGVSHFAFPLFASRGEVLEGPAAADYVKLMTGLAGGSETAITALLSIYNGISELFGADDVTIPLYTFGMYLTSAILILDSDIPDGTKESYARILMQDFIKAANTGGTFGETLEGNAYMGVVFKLANKYLNAQRNSEADSAALQEIWSGAEASAALNGIKASVAKVATPQSLANDTMPFDDLHNRLHWQHNLPLLRPVPKDSDALLPTLWKEHNPNDRIGGWFVWLHKSPYRFVKSADRWYENFPGWSRSSFDADEAHYAASLEKKYNKKAFLEREILSSRGHSDNQVEGAGLGLWFLRMLLTEINPVRYPPPNLADRDVRYPMLPWPAAEPSHLEQLRYELSRKKVARIEGDRDRALRVVSLGPEDAGTHNFVLAYAAAGDKLRLVPGFVTDGYTENGEFTPAGIYLNNIAKDEQRFGSSFDLLELAVMRGPGSKRFVVVAERAEDKSAGFDDHWLRVSLWESTAATEGHASDLRYRNKWASENRRPGAVDGLDLAILDNRYAVVMHRTAEGENRIKVIDINLQNYAMSMLSGQVVSSETCDRQLALTTAHDEFVIYNHETASSWRLASAKWNGSSLVTVSTSTRFDPEREKLLDLTTTRAPRLSASGEVGFDYYVVAVIRGANAHVRVMSWAVGTDGVLSYKGDFRANKDAKDYLYGSEAEWERASAVSYLQGLWPGFVIAGKGAAREVADKEGNWARSEAGLKVLNGYIMPDGRPTLVGSSVAGNGSGDGMDMLDVTSMLGYGDGAGVLSAHKTEQGDLNLIFWRYDDYLGGS